jgi:GntR family transcriptional regulator
VEPRVADTLLPLYHQVYLLLRQRIEAGQFASDAPMPGENALAAEYGVSRLTLRRSLDQLEAEGLVLRRRGSGTYAAEPALARPQRGDDIDALMAHLSAMGEHTEVRLLAVELQTPPADVALGLGLAPGARAQKSVRVRSHGGTPFSHLVAYVPEDIAARYSRQDLATRPLLQILRSLGIRLAAVEQAISAVLADLDTAAALEASIGSPLLSIRRVVRDDKGRAVEYLQAVYRPDRYEYRMNLSANEVEGAL